ncbi:MAG: hypothetical protein ABJ327_22960 [Litoreibacter sp.]
MAESTATHDVLSGSGSSGVPRNIEQAPKRSLARLPRVRALSAHLTVARAGVDVGVAAGTVHTARRRI